MAKKVKATDVKVEAKDLKEFTDLLNRRKQLEEVIALGYKNLMKQEAEIKRVVGLHDEVQDAVQGQLKAWEEISGPNYQLDLDKGVLIHPDNQIKDA